MARFQVGERVRLSGTIPGIGSNVDGQLGTVMRVDSGVDVAVDLDDRQGRWIFYINQVERVGDRPVSILGKAAKEILDHHVSVEDRDFDTVPQCYMTVGELRSIVGKAKEEGAL